MRLATGRMVWRCGGHLDDLQYVSPVQETEVRRIAWPMVAPLLEKANARDTLLRRVLSAWDTRAESCNLNLPAVEAVMNDIRAALREP